MPKIWAMIVHMRLGFLSVRTLGLRMSQEEEFDGADLSIHKINASPERELSW
jgi:Amt family ammonium transporter